LQKSKLEKEYNITSGHRFRSKNDIQIAFAYFHYLNEWNSNLLPQNTIENGENYGVYIGLRPGGLKQALENYLRPNFFLPYKYGLKYLWICVNDNLDPDHPDFLSAINLGIILKFFISVKILTDFQNICLARTQSNVNSMDKY